MPTFNDVQDIQLMGLTKLEIIIHDDDELPFPYVFEYPHEESTWDWVSLDGPTSLGIPRILAWHLTATMIFPWNQWPDMTTVFQDLQSRKIVTATLYFSGQATQPSRGDLVITTNASADLNSVGVTFKLGQKGLIPIITFNVNAWFSRDAFAGGPFA